METSQPSTVPDDLQKSLFTLCDSDILAQDIVEVLKEVLATVEESGGNKSSSKLTPRIKTLIKATEQLHSNIKQSVKLSRHASFPKEKAEIETMRNEMQRKQDL
jgi:molybdenum-dependent DNA-binding transcriptional regulator ModE